LLLVNDSTKIKRAEYLHEGKSRQFEGRFATNVVVKGEVRIYFSTQFLCWKYTFS